jgi:hypothetical protein
MKIRLVLAAALAGGLLASISGAEAATKVIDGKKVKVLTMKNAPGTVQDQQEYLDYDSTLCNDKVLCPKLTFVYKPATGVKGGLLFTTTWSNQLTDIDIQVVQYDSRNNGTVVGSCGGSSFTSEKIYLASSELKKGANYALVVHMFRTVAETAVTSKVQIGVKSTIPTTVPEAADLGINCTL